MAKKQNRRKNRKKRVKRNVIAQNVGIDMSKSSFSVCFSIEDDGRIIVIKKTGKFSNTAKGFAKFVIWVEKMRKEGIPLFFTFDYHVSVELPNKAKAYAKSLNVKTKTDKVDAKILAQMGLERRLARWIPASTQMYELKKECRERIRLVEFRTALKNQIHAEKHSAKPNEKMLCRSQETIALLNKQISQIEKDARKRVNKDKELKEKIDNICQVKGLGFISVLTVIAETNGFVLFTNGKQLTSYSGYDIVQRESGSSINGKNRISKKGNSYIRGILYMPALAAIRYNEEFKNLYERVFERTRISKKGNVAVQRKLLLLIYTLFTKNEPYDPNYWKKQGNGPNSIQKTVGINRVSETEVQSNETVQA